MKRIVLLVYNLLLPPVLLAMLPAALAKNRRRGGFAGTLPARLGLMDKALLHRIGTGRIWIHAVSVGEVGIARKFLAAYHVRNPGTRFLLTSTTPTGLAVASTDAPEWLEVVPNPIDLPLVTSRLVRRLRPAALLMVEADLWPNRIAAAKALGIPVALLNARLSPRSERRFRAVKQLSAALFNQLDLITLTDSGDPERWMSLEVDQRILTLTGNMKHDAPEAEAARDDAGHTPVFLAASTHSGEERAVAEAWQRLRSSHPGLRLVIAPRHAERRGEIRTELASLGLPCSLRSEGGDGSDQVLLLDTTGELSSWYPRATVVFVGKSLTCSVNRGGQNMIEPLQAGCPVLVGPHTANFEPLASDLVKAGALIRVDDASTLADAVERFLLDPETGRTMVGRASAVLESHRGSVERTCTMVERLLASQA